MLFRIPSVFFEPPIKVKAIPEPTLPDDLDSPDSRLHAHLHRPRVRSDTSPSHPHLRLLSKMFPLIGRLSVYLESPGDLGREKRVRGVGFRVGDDQVGTFPVETGRVFSAEVADLLDHALPDLGCGRNEYVSTLCRARMREEGDLDSPGSIPDTAIVSPAKASNLYLAIDYLDAPHSTFSDQLSSWQYSSEEEELNSRGSEGPRDRSTRSRVHNRSIPAERSGSYIRPSATTAHPSIHNISSAPSRPDSHMINARKPRNSPHTSSSRDPG